MPQAKLENTRDINFMVDDPALENGTSMDLDYRLCEMVILPGKCSLLHDNMPLPCIVVVMRICSQALALTFLLHW